MTIADWERQAEARQQGLMPQWRPFIRVRDATLPEILRSGRFKSQFETNGYGSRNEPHVRRHLELALFDLPPSTPDHLRPIYGYLHPSEDGWDAVTGPGSNPYGRIALRLKPTVRERTTFTGDDTLILTKAAHSLRFASSDAYIAQMQPMMSPEPLIAPRWTAFPRGYGDILDIKDAFAFLKVMWGQANAPYFEAQYHFGLTVADIESAIILPRKRPVDSSVLDALTTAGIPYKVL